MQKTLIFIILFSLFACQSGPKSNFDKNFVRLYAELSLLNEKEKLAAKSSDSLYQIKVHEFLVKNGTTEEYFREQSNAIMKDYKNWQIFLQEVSRTVDSLKAIKG